MKGFDVLDLIESFLSPRSWKSTFLRRLFVITLPVSGPIWVLMMLILAVALILIISVEEFIVRDTKLWRWIAETWKGKK